MVKSFRNRNKSTKNKKQKRVQKSKRKNNLKKKNSRKNLKSFRGGDECKSFNNDMEGLDVFKEFEEKRDMWRAKYDEWYAYKWKTMIKKGTDKVAAKKALDKMIEKCNTENSNKQKRDAASLTFDVEYEEDRMNASRRSIESSPEAEEDAPQAMDETVPSVATALERPTRRRTRRRIDLKGRQQRSNKRRKAQEAAAAQEE